MASPNDVLSAPCPICESSSPVRVSLKIFEVSRNLHQCPTCEAAFYSNPDWLDRAYSNVINSLDTGIVERCFDLANVLTSFLSGHRGDVILDFGGGIGLLSRIMRDRGFDFHSSDPMAEYRLPLPAPNDGPVAMATMIEVLEHLVDPLSELREITTLTPTIFISTHLIPSSGLTADWPYLQPQTGQHIFFCTPKTLRRIADHLDMSVTSNGQNLHVLHRAPLSLRQRAFIKFQQPAWVFGHLASVSMRGRSLAESDALKAEGQ